MDAKNLLEDEKKNMIELRVGHSRQCAQFLEINVIKTVQ